MAIPGVVLDVALKSGINLMYGLNAALILFGTTVTQCLIFVPKVCQHSAEAVLNINAEYSTSEDFIVDNFAFNIYCKITGICHDYAQGFCSEVKFNF